jgi:uncharacterized membrane protein
MALECLKNHGSINNLFQSRISPVTDQSEKMAVGEKTKNDKRQKRISNFEKKSEVSSSSDFTLSSRTSSSFGYPPSTLQFILFGSSHHPEAATKEAIESMSDTIPKQEDGATIPAGDNNGDYVQVDAPARRAHLCCGCCCDTRRALIVVNIITLSLNALGLLSLSMITSVDVSQFDDDETINALNNLDGAPLGWSMAFLAIGMVTAIVGIYGGYKFQGICVMIAGVYYALSCIQGMIFMNLGGAIMAGFFAYPHFVFYQEMKKGIMSPQTYPNEQACCGC